MLSSISILFVLISTIFLSYTSKQYYTSSHYGIVVEETIPIFEDKDTNNQLNFNLTEGDRVKIVKEIKDRYIIELNNTEICSVKKTGIKKI